MERFALAGLARSLCRGEVGCRGSGVPDSQEMFEIVGRVGIAKIARIAGYVEGVIVGINDLSFPKQKDYCSSCHGSAIRW